MKTNLKRYVIPNVHSSAIFSGQDIEATCVRQQMDKEDMVCVHIYIYTHTHIYTQWNITKS